jgi:DNA primase
MSRSERRLERVKEEIDIIQLLEDFGYPVRTGMDREQQFSCDLHGDGLDGKPSARVYPESKSWYCFACDKTRDQVETVREKRGLQFMEAIGWLERTYNLPAMSWEAGDERRVLVGEEVAQTLKPGRTFEDDRKSLETTLQSYTSERDLTPKLAASLWEAYDKIIYLTLDEKGKRLDERQGRLALAKLRGRALERYKEWASATSES